MPCEEGIFTSEGLGPCLQLDQILALADAIAIAKVRNERQKILIEAGQLRRSDKRIHGPRRDGAFPELPRHSIDLRIWVRET
jgi:hypothetical protein